MSEKPNTAAKTHGLRHRAETELHKRPIRRSPDNSAAKASTDARRLLHELQVHQVELEMQNAELQDARNRMEALLEKYTDLYDFAPVGYFSLDVRSHILEANLTGALLLGVERSRLLNQPMLRFVDAASRKHFRSFLERLFATPGEQRCEATLAKADGAEFWAHFQGSNALSTSAPQRSCRVAVLDRTAIKEAEEAQRQMEALALSNRDLRREIVRRQAVEEALKHSEQHQSLLLEQSRHMQAQLKSLSHQLLQSQEEERKRISRELHDEITQTLVSINVHLEALAREAVVHPSRLKRKVTRTQRLVEKSVEIVHRFARELRPAALDDLGLITALHTYLKDFLQRTGIRAHFTAFAGVERLNSARRTVLYRVVQSALANVAEHAQASRVKVDIRRRSGAVRLEISDNGQSFDVERVLHAKRNKRLGLVGMRERVEMVGGLFEVESRPGQGTTIRAEIPLN